MQFCEFLTPSSVFIDSAAQSKTAVLLKLSQILSQNHPELNAEALFDAYWKRESLGSTTIGHGIIIPHIRAETINKTCGCFLKLLNPVDFGAADKQPVDLVLGFVVPQGQNDQHLQILGKSIKQFSMPEYRNAYRKAENSESLYALLIEHSYKVCATPE
ncbi:phosphotransferase system mannitol/fructose-specific IIA domain Ntr-type [Legionella oakridgensis ATCC 33761 = DSM 21215]|uniref:Phosphotransferase system mannitol/fructose-specific IIA domain Ntr-type n=3 Tax=Legionella oakridgensis TaxID=29423 RepID=W0BCF2_9GAMM|nr:PTS sugar transporter subunit IIA [Legionella oakridgensis]AHE66361.1 phosphotransferase system mannitol/fructose-specific IIA domain Ntr-type [Legionella oakridgensis ATCC 33761 = DSM 21215]ETO93867.1 PTS IIA-like nitrogen-regulatory protein PtsN [Legionella oakridgensis RV-2-2007]KTD44002.1 Nitrogen regulatory protein [Legionella oakridgensis]STY19545.1 Nitrogen regulatory protein [Legionella longbeachae]